MYKSQMQQNSDQAVMHWFRSNLNQSRNTTTNSHTATNSHTTTTVAAALLAHGHESTGKSAIQMTRWDDEIMYAGLHLDSSGSDGQGYLAPGGVLSCGGCAACGEVACVTPPPPSKPTESIDELIDTCKRCLGLKIEKMEGGRVLRIDLEPCFVALVSVGQQTESDAGSPTTVPTVAKLCQRASKEPVQTTKVPVQTTKVPVQTTKVPVQTTKVPVQTTKVPVQTTKVLSETTKAPLQTTRVPVQTTKVPVQTTRVPVQTTKMHMNPTGIVILDADTSMGATQRNTPLSRNLTVRARHALKVFEEQNERYGATALELLALWLYFYKVNPITNHVPTYDIDIVSPLNSDRVSQHTDRQQQEEADRQQQEEEAYNNTSDNGKSTTPVGTTNNDASWLNSYNDEYLSTCTWQSLWNQAMELHAVFGC